MDLVGAGLAAELDRLVSEALAALTILDADVLENLGQRAGALAALNLGGAAVDAKNMVPLLTSKIRTFSAVLQATSENLVTLQRADGHEVFGQARLGTDEGTAFEGYAAAQRGVFEGFGQERFARREGQGGLFESLGLYDDSEGRRSIWPRAQDTTGPLSGLKRDNA